MGIARGPSWRPTGVLCFILVSALLCTVTACGGSGEASGEGCGVPGYTRECFENCDYGTETCQLDGLWSACVCSDGPGSSTAGTKAGTTAGATAGTTAGTGVAGTAGSDGGAGSGGALDAGVDAAQSMDAATSTDGAALDSGPIATPFYTRCAKATECPDGTMCTRSSVGGGATGNTGFCTVKCTQASECPAPSTGTATVACSSSGVCQPRCGVGISCPDGLVCVNLGPSGTCI